MKIRVNHQPSGGKEWVAKIIGKDPRYKFAREFQSIEEKEWSSTGKTGWSYFEVEEGQIYEVNEPWHGRYFIKIENGEMKEITKEEVTKRIEEMEMEKVKEEKKETKKMKKEEFMEEVEKNEEDGHKKVKMQGTKKLEDGTIYEVHFEADYEKNTKKFDVFVNGEQIDRFHETKKILWYKALAKAPSATLVMNFGSEQEFQDYVGKVRKWFEDSGYKLKNSGKGLPPFHYKKTRR